MTCYFDDMDKLLRDVDFSDWDSPQSWETKLVYDCLLASELPNFPPEFAPLIHDVVLKWGVRSVPDLAEPDFETQEDYRRRLQNLSFDLHSAFHAIAESGGLSDSPVNFARGIVMRAEDKLEQLARLRADPNNETVQAIARRQHRDFLECSMEIPPELQQLLDKLPPEEKET